MKLRMKFNILAALICLLCLPIASCQEAGSDVYFKGISLYSAKGGVTAAGASCSTANDSDQVGNGNTSSATLSGYYSCVKFQFSGAGDVTEFVMRIGDTASATDFQGQLWADDDANDRPDLDGVVMGEVTVEHEDVGVPEDQLFTFATPVAVSGSTDYWVCVYTDNGADVHNGYYEADSGEAWGNRMCFISETTPGNGTCYDDYNLGEIVRGCLD